MQSWNFWTLIRSEMGYFMTGKASESFQNSRIKIVCVTGGRGLALDSMHRWRNTDCIANRWKISSASVGSVNSIHALVWMVSDSTAINCNSSRLWQTEVFCFTILTNKISQITVSIYCSLKSTADLVMTSRVWKVWIKDAANCHINN